MPVWSTVWLLCSAPRPVVGTAAVLSCHEYSWEPPFRGSACVWLGGINGLQLTQQTRQGDSLLGAQWSKGWAGEVSAGSLTTGCKESNEQEEKGRAQRGQNWITLRALAQVGCAEQLWPWTRCWGVALSVEHLPSKHESLGLIPGIAASSCGGAGL